jgi:hypothetical protein
MQVQRGCTICVRGCSGKPGALKRSERVRTCSERPDPDLVQTRSGARPPYFIGSKRSAKSILIGKKSGHLRASAY